MTMTASSRRPLSYFSNAPWCDTLARACAATLISVRDGRRETAIKVATREWGPESDAVRLLHATRAAVVPTSTGTTGGGDNLVMGAIPDFIMSMGPMSAAPILNSRGLALSFDGFGVINIPSYVPSTSNASFVGEGQPIPARQLALDAISLTPYKFASLISFTREMLVGSTPTIVKVVSDAMTANIGLDLDSAEFDTNVATAIRPAGLRNGVTVTAHEATASGDEAMKIDLATLAASVSAVAGNGPIVFVCAPRQAVTVKIRQPQFPYEVLSSSALTPGTVICVAANAVASAIDPTPLIDTRTQVGFHENSVPLPIVDGSSTPAALTRSSWQTDSIGLKIVLQVAWTLRSASGLSWTSSVVW
jgi:Phage capsid family